MKKILFTTALILSTLAATAKNALVVISHGSPMEEWRKPVLDLEPLLQQRIKQLSLDKIDYIRVAMMEFTEPTIASVIADCERQGCDTVFAIPLFIAPSGHSDEDIPNIIGHKYNPATVQELKEEGTKFVNSRLTIILGPTLSYNRILEDIMAKNVKALSKSPKDEALLVVSHGDKQWYSFWDKKMKSICDTCATATGIAKTDYKFVAMGHKMAREILPVIQEFAKTKKRIIVQGVYITSTAQEIATLTGVDEMVKKSLNNPSAEVIYSDKGILPFAQDEIADWIIERVREWKPVNVTR